MGIPAPLGVAASGVPPAGDLANVVVSGQFTGVGQGRPFAFRGPLNIAIYASINTTLTTLAGSLAASVASSTGLAVGNSINSSLVPKGTIIGALPGGNAVTLDLPSYFLPGIPQAAGGNLIVGLPLTTGLIGATVTGTGIPASTTVVEIVTAAVGGAGGVVRLSAAPTITPTLNAPIPLEFALTANIIGAGADTAAIFTGAAIVWSGTMQVERSFDGGATWICCNVGGSGALAQYTAGSPVSISFGEPERDVLYRVNCIAYTSGTINYRMSQSAAAAESLGIPLLS